MESVKPCRDILMERALQMSFAGLKIKESPTSSQADIDNLFRHIVAINPTMTLEVTTKDTLKAHPQACASHAVHFPDKELWERG